MQLRAIFIQLPRVSSTLRGKHTSTVWTPLKPLAICAVMADWELGMRGTAMAGQPGFFDGDEWLKALSAAGDPLERLLRIIEFEVFISKCSGAIWKRRCRGRIGRTAVGRLTTLC